MNALLNDIASQYFDYLSETYPVMCASDEFHFLPRAENARKYYDKLESLDAEKINESIHRLKDFQQNLINLSSTNTELEHQIDRELLMANIAGVIIELEKNQSWRHNPLLYLKIACIGIDHALTKPAETQNEITERAKARLVAIPDLLNQAVANLSTIPETFYQACLSMADDCNRYISETAGFFSKDTDSHLLGMFQKSQSAFTDFRRFLKSVSPVPDSQFLINSQENSLTDHFLSIRTRDEIYQIAVDSWHENLNQLEMLQKKIDPVRSWQNIYHDTSFKDMGQTDTFTLYNREIEKMRQFFSGHGFRKDYLNSPIELAETPTYLQSIRGTASFCAAFSTDKKEKSFFYLTTRLPEHSRFDIQDQLRKRFHREYKYLTAHETIPGHHFLDTVRRQLKNSIRRQIESPLFYEGWASYAESLLTELGYVRHPAEYMVDYKRRLWRAARCRIDIGLPAGLMTMKDATALLVTAGFSEEEAKRQIYRFQLNPGYQLCYTLGHYEINQLKKTFEPRIGAKQFHSCLLEGGELPFHLIEKKFNRLGKTDVA